ncbi:hypothetical protein HDU99_010992 [Rhizoclosmatium hyalinum]|nr:hypothetical protein HDU99_010992 [Rhizoclosmatium hyalinum]
MRHLDSGTVCVDVYGNVVSAWNVNPGQFYFVNSDPVQHAYATIKMPQFPSHVAALDIATYRKFLYNASEGRVCVAAAHYTPNLFPFTAAEQITFLGNQRYINQDNFADGTPGKGFNVDVASLRQKLVVVCAEPGTRKTNLIKQIVDKSSQGARILLVAPGRALVDGLVDKLKSRHFASYRRVAGSPDPWENSDYIVSTPDSVINAVEGFDLIIFDEPDKSLTHITSTLFNNYTTGRVMDKILALVREAGTKTILLQAKITNPTVEFFLEACKVDRYDITESKFFNIDYAPPRAPFRLFSSLNQGLSEAIPKIISRIKAPEPVKALIFCHSLGTLLIISAMIQSQLEVHQRDTVIELYSNIIHTDAVKEYLRNPNHESQNKYQLCLFTSVADTGVSFEQRDIAVYVLENGVAGFNQLQQSCQRGRYYENQQVFVIMPKGLPSAQIVEKSHLRSNFSGLDTELKASCDDLAVKIPSQQWFNKYVTAAKEDEAASTHYSANNAYQLFAAQPGATEVLDANANTMTDDVVFINKLFTTMEYLISTEVAFETNPSSSLIGKLTRRTLTNVKNSVSRRFGIGGGPRLNRHEGGAGAGGRNAEAVIAANELDIFPEYHISTHTTLRFQQGLCTDVVVNLGKQIDLIHIDLTQTLDITLKQEGEERKLVLKAIFAGSIPGFGDRKLPGLSTEYRKFTNYVNNLQLLAECITNPSHYLTLVAANSHDNVERARVCFAIAIRELWTAKFLESHIDFSNPDTILEWENLILENKVVVEVITKESIHNLVRKKPHGESEGVEAIAGVNQMNLCRLFKKLMAAMGFPIIEYDLYLLEENNTQQMNPEEFDSGNEHMEAMEVEFSVAGENLSSNPFILCIDENLLLQFLCVMKCHQTPTSWKHLVQELSKDNGLLATYSPKIEAAYSNFIEIGRLMTTLPVLSEGLNETDLENSQPVVPSSPLSPPSSPLADINDAPLFGNHTLDTASQNCDSDASDDSEIPLLRGGKHRNINVRNRFPLVLLPNSQPIVQASSITHTPVPETPSVQSMQFEMETVPSPLETNIFNANVEETTNIPNFNVPEETTEVDSPLTSLSSNFMHDSEMDSFKDTTEVDSPLTSLSSNFMYDSEMDSSLTSFVYESDTASEIFPQPVQRDTTGNHVDSIQTELGFLEQNPNFFTDSDSDVDVAQDVEYLHAHSEEFDNFSMDDLTDEIALPDGQTEINFLLSNPEFFNSDDYI